MLLKYVAKGPTDAILARSARVASSNVFAYLRRWRSCSRLPRWYHSDARDPTLPRHRASRRRHGDVDAGARTRRSPWRSGGRSHCCVRVLAAARPSRSTPALRRSAPAWLPFCRGLGFPNRCARSMRSMRPMCVELTVSLSACARLRPRVSRTTSAGFSNLLQKPEPRRKYGTYRVARCRGSSS